VLIISLLFPGEQYRFEWTADAHPMAYHYTLPLFPQCVIGPSGTATAGCEGRFDMDGDLDVDLRDLHLYLEKT
jgi:hypothetical protein